MAILKKTVTLNPGESQVVAFSFTPSVIKSYTVTVDGLSGSFNVIEVPAAEFVVSDLIIEPTTVYVGQAVIISVVITNTGFAAGSYDVTCEVL